MLWASIPCRVMLGCFFTLTFIYKSPPLWPLPRNLRTESLSIPFGKVIYSATFLDSIPDPLQVVQGLVIFLPYPPQELQAVLSTIIPCLKVIKPVPWQVLHFCGWVPGFDFLPLQVEQVPFLLYFMVFVIVIVLFLFHLLLLKIIILL